MRFTWPADTVFTQHILPVEQETCTHCQRRLHICDHRVHRIYTLEGPVEMVCKLAHCPDRACPGHAHTQSPRAEAQLTLPWWTIGWDVFCWIGYRRFARHWSIAQLRAELCDAFHIRLSDDAIAGYLRRYQTMVAARHQDPDLLAAAYRDLEALVLCIDGLQPEKGHETLYVVRELVGKRVWFAEALLSSSVAEIQRLIAKAKDWAARLGKPVVLWMSDKQEAFGTAIAAEFPDVPHRYCQNHFLRDVARPVLEADSQAKVQMRSHVRGLRAIEQDVLAQQREAAQVAAAASVNPQTGAEVVVAAADAATAGAVVLDYCAAVRGILNDSQGGPLEPPGLRMAAALNQVQESIQRNLAAKKGGVPRNN
jgi:hypothetical protein